MKRKITLVSSNFLILCLTLISFGVYAQSSCDVDISAKKNRNSKNVSDLGSSYRMVITNNGDSADTFILSSKDVNSSCSNPDGSSSVNNVVLAYEFLDANNNKVTEISLNVGETYNFLVSVIVPSATKKNSWSCVEIMASSSKCDNYSATTLLQSMVIDPNQD